MSQSLKEKTKEAFASVLPISLIVLMLSTIFIPMSLGTLVMFMVGAAFLVLGMGLFSLGVDMAMTPIGEGLGTQLAENKIMWVVAGICFLVGFITTIAEPDLQVLAKQVVAIPDIVLILTVAVGVGIFLVIAMIRLVFKISLHYMLLAFYILMFILSVFTPNNFVAVAFDSGGVTTGPMTVPFILALGVGLAGMSKDKDSQSDNFGFVALCSVGPILAVMILGICYNPQEAGYSETIIPEVETMRDVLIQFNFELPAYFKEVLYALVPIGIFFIAFQLVSKRFKKRQIAKIAIGMIYTLIGLVLFLTGVNVGFIPVGSLLGKELAGSPFKWLLIPIGMLIGYFIVAAEPAIHVLNKQVEEVSRGAIPKKAMNLCVSIGVAVSVGISMVRVLTGISIYWFLIPGYVIALILTFKVPKIFTGIAFDSGGVASGPMTSTFLLPFIIGVCESTGGNVLTDAFGVVAMVAMAPVISVQLMGFFYKNKMDVAIEKDPLDDIDIGLDELMEMWR